MSRSFGANDDRAAGVRRSPIRICLIAAAVASTVLGRPPTVTACPMCAETLNGEAGGAADAAGTQVSTGGDSARGYYWSILFMLSMPFLLVTAMAAMLYFAVQGRKRAGATPPGLNPQSLSAEP